MRPRYSIHAAVLAVAAAIVVCAWPRPSEAGIVVLKNGEVFVGRVGDVTPADLVVRWPYKDEVDRGTMRIPRYRIRWFDLEADEPTDEYWEEFENEPIAPRFLPLLEKWRIRNQGDDEYGLDVPLFIPELGSRGKLDLRPIKTDFFEVRKPEEWTSRTEGDIWIFESNQDGSDGYRPRIHVFSVESLLDAGHEEAGVLVMGEVRRVADDFAEKEANRPRLVAGGWDHQLQTSTTRGGTTVTALRKIAFRKARTYFFTAYAHERDYPALLPLFEQCLESLKIKEDESSGEDEEGGGSRRSAGSSDEEGSD